MSSKRPVPSIFRVLAACQSALYKWTSTHLRVTAGRRKQWRGTWTSTASQAQGLATEHVVIQLSQARGHTEIALRYISPQMAKLRQVRELTASRAQLECHWETGMTCNNTLLQCLNSLRNVIIEYTYLISLSECVSTVPYLLSNLLNNVISCDTEPTKAKSVRKICFISNCRRKCVLLRYVFFLSVLN